MRRLRGAAFMAAELVVWIFVLPVALARSARRPGRHDDAEVETRARTLLRWYPAAWRDRHGEPFAALLCDAIEGGEDGLRLELDVARAGIAERVRTRRASRLLGMLAAGLGWTMILPQGIVAAIFGAVGGIQSGWFLAPHVAAPGRWLVVTGMLAAGATLVAASFALVAHACPPRHARSR